MGLFHRWLEYVKNVPKQLIRSHRIKRKKTQKVLFTCTLTVIVICHVPSTHAYQPKMTQPPPYPLQDYDGYICRVRIPLIVIYDPLALSLPHRRQQVQWHSHVHIAKAEYSFFLSFLLSFFHAPLPPPPSPLPLPPQSLSRKPLTRTNRFLIFSNDASLFMLDHVRMNLIYMYVYLHFHPR